MNKDAAAVWAVRCPKCDTPTMPEKVLGTHSLKAFYRCACGHKFEATAYLTVNHPTYGSGPMGVRVLG